LNEYEVTLVYGQTIDTNSVEADGHRIETSQDNSVPPFIVFYRDLPPLIDPLSLAHAPDPASPTACVCGWEAPLGRPAMRTLDEHIAESLNLQPTLQMDGEPLFSAHPSGDGDPTPTATAVNATGQLEVFRAPLHALLSIRLLFDEDDDE
jgi:hypothetical protein